MSVPGTDDDKLQLINCVSCHTLERVVKSSHDADEFVQVVARMNGYAQVSQPIKPQRRVDLSRAANPERFRKVAEYLATINLSSGMKHEFELKTLPRVKGRGTNVIITEYDLPRPTIEPHDVIIVNGEAWYTNFGEQFLGKLDPKTGQHTEYAMPELRKGFPTGNLDLGIDREGHLLLGMMYQGGVARFDPKTEKFQIRQLPPERLKDDLQLNMVMRTQAHVDGKLWVNDAGSSTLLRLDLATGKFEEFDPLSILPGGRQGYSIYDVRADFGTTSTSRTSRRTTWSRSTPRPASSPPTRPARRSRATGAAASTIRIDFGSRNIAATRSRCSTPRRSASRNGRCRPSSRSPTT